MRILAAIHCLAQHIKTLQLEPERYRQISCCPGCGKTGLWHHGHYPRKADRSGVKHESLNPIFIPRFFCSDCQRTCSVLPECLAPRRWYSWLTQQAALVAVLLGKSFHAIAHTIAPSRSTISRWIKRFREQSHFLLCKDTLCNHFSELGRTKDFAEFWQECFATLSLAQAMRLCHIAGVSIP